jgi:hypothetical protein
MLFSALLLCIAVLAQNRTVTGRITDAQGRPVPFASITIQGTSTGVSADDNGNFSIAVPANATLMISASGYQNTTFNTGTRTSLAITLNSSANSNLSEVVVIRHNHQQRKPHPECSGNLDGKPRR